MIKANKMEMKLIKEDENLYHLYLKGTDVWLTAEDMTKLGGQIFAALLKDEKAGGLIELCNKITRQEIAETIKSLRP